jgi:hypothetical protein
VYKSVPLQCGHALDNDGPSVSLILTVLRTCGARAPDFHGAQPPHRVTKGVVPLPLPGDWARRRTINAGTAQRITKARKIKGLTRFHASGSEKGTRLE